ncbi:MAG: FAD-binding protein [Actinomycetota bacterium]|nr:FAD-binding protein [Actinomycetota bacterium]
MSLSASPADRRPDNGGYVSNWDESFDLVIVGSGGGGLVAGLAAADAGLRPVILEKQGIVGGSTAMSGGIIWLPNNPLMKADGVEDSFEDGLAYLEAVVGDIGPASSLERREMFLSAGSDMIQLLLDKGLRLVRCPGYSDYYPNHKGGNADGRSLEGVPFDLRELGEWHDKLPPAFSSYYGLVFKTNEIRLLPYFNRAPAAFAVAARSWLRTKLARARHQELVANGASLVGQLLKAVLANRIPLWLNATFDDLVVEEGAVTGVRIMRDGSPVFIQARKGVLLSAGGFSRSAEMRREYSGHQPNEAQWSLSNPGDTGEVLSAAMRLGARVDLMDEAIWNPNPAPEFGLSSIALARSRPGAILVNQAGLRFCNEANDYIEVGRAMYANDAVPAWLIFDDGYRRRYRNTAKDYLPTKFPQEWLDRGLLKKADSLGSLAQAIGVDPGALTATVKRFNDKAALGLDPEFGRGQSAFNLCWGDPGYKPNGALGPLDRAPFYATKIFPGDVGTCGGAVTNEYAQVLKEDFSPIPGLYATGNTTATLMGRRYPGAGASIANTTVFGYVAARHAAGILTKKGSSR